MSEETDDTTSTTGFGAALRELEGIVAELESDELDVDRLADRVARAGELVRTCRARLDAAEFAVDEVLRRDGDD